VTSGPGAAAGRSPPGAGDVTRPSYAARGSNPETRLEEILVRGAARLVRLFAEPGRRVGPEACSKAQSQSLRTLDATEPRHLFEVDAQEGAAGSTTLFVRVAPRSLGPSRGRSPRKRAPARAGEAEHAGRKSAHSVGGATPTPMMWETAFLLTPPTRAFVGGSSRPERGLALIAGTDGVAVRFDGDRPMSSVIE
jgi:hypothetical protein